MIPESHTEPLIATAATGVTVLGMIDSIREQVHALTGLIGDIGGMLITLLTLAWWLRVWLKRHHVEK